MKNLKLKLEQQLPFLNLAPLDGPESAGGSAAASARLEAGASLFNVSIRAEQFEGDSLEGVNLFRATLHRLTFKDLSLRSCVVRTSTLTASIMENVDLSSSFWAIVDAESSVFRMCTMDEVYFQGVSLRETQWEESSLRGAHLCLVDFFGARLNAVDLSKAMLTGADFSFAVLEGVDFSGADLSGTNFAHATMSGVNFDGARLCDADFRGVRGLTGEERAALRAGGARFRGDGMEGLIGRLLDGIRPDAEGARNDASARRLALAIRGLVVVGAILFAVYLFYIQNTEGSTQADAGRAIAPPTDYRPTAEEIRKTKENLAILREAIERAYQASGIDGMPKYPTIEDLSNNEFDLDGFGPGTEKAELVPGGLPLNFLSPGEGVVPYCNDPPTQNTLTGDDSDWHYCEETGRVYACGGYTDEPTLDW